jgi:ADP-heptose:LPS heptosyltransferase
MQRILILRFSSFGDVVLLSALLEELHRRQPRAELWLVTKAAYAGFFEGDPRLAQLLTLDAGRGKLWALHRRLSAVEFDLVLDAHGSLRSRLLCVGLSGGPLRRIHKDTASRLLFLRTGVRTRALQRHQVDRYLGLVGAEGAETRPRILLREKDRAEAERFLGTDPGEWLALAPGARHAPKRWPLERFTEFARGFQESGRGRVVLVGGPEERGICEELASRLPQESLVAAGELSLRGSAAVLERARVLVCNDSGLMHLAEAVGTPVLAVFGPTSRELGYFPLDPRSRVLEQFPPCRPCSRNGAVPCRLDEPICLTHTTAVELGEALEAQWT